MGKGTKWEKGFFSGEATKTTTAVSLSPVYGKSCVVALKKRSKVGWYSSSCIPAMNGDRGGGSIPLMEK